MKLGEVTNAEELIQYLNAPQRLGGVTMLNQYLRWDSLTKIFESRSLLLNNPNRMNDLYEYRAFGQTEQWRKICFASFITQSTESMAMWSMYAQPWERGVKISIPLKAMKELIEELKSQSNTKVFLESAIFNRNIGRYEFGGENITSACEVSLPRVAYKDGDTITCTGRNDRITRLGNPYLFPELSGYIKDTAWSYEKEVRLRIDLPDNCEYDAAYLHLSDEFLRQITITTGPFFEGDVCSKLPEEYRDIKNENSKFSGLFRWKFCDDCEYKNSCNNEKCKSKK